MGPAAPDPTDPGTTGRSLPALLLEVFRSRLELWSLELHEHLLGLFLLVLLGLACVFLVLLGVTILTVAVVFLAWSQPTTRFVGLLLFGFLYGLGGMALAFWARRIWKRLLSQAPFPQFIEELEKDRKWLERLFKS
jgi:uncharacterized membrane protein YqjE